MIELYIDNKKADIDQNTNITFIYQTTDFEKPTAIKNNFSQSIELPGTVNNNTIFGHIWKLDRNIIENDSIFTGVNFNPHKRVNYTLTNNGQMVNSGYIQLDEVNRKNDVITYSITLYGGLGDFFYSISSDEDGNERKLDDMYYKFCDADGNEISKEDEDNKNLFTFNNDFIYQSWASLNSDPKSKVKVNELFTAVPAYGGYYEDFENNKQAINYNFLGVAEKTYFPDKSGYTRLNGYYLTETTRDLDEWEVKCLYAKKQHPAIKLSKVIDAICDSDNNGGYNVKIDDDILNSYIYKFGWVTTDRFSKDDGDDYVVDKVEADAITQTFANSNRQRGAVPSSTSNWFNVTDDTPMDISPFEQPYLTIKTTFAFSVGLPNDSYSGQWFNQGSFKSAYNSSKTLLSCLLVNESNKDTYVNLTGIKYLEVAGFLVCYTMKVDGVEKKFAKFVTSPIIEGAGKKTKNGYNYMSNRDLVYHVTYLPYNDFITTSQSKIFEYLGVDDFDGYEWELTKFVKNPEMDNISQWKDARKIEYNFDVDFSAMINQTPINGNSISDIKTYGKFVKFDIMYNSKTDSWSFVEDTDVNLSFYLGDVNSNANTKSFNFTDVFQFDKGVYNTEQATQVVATNTFDNKKYDVITVNKKLFFSKIDATPYDFLTSFTKMIGAMYTYDYDRKTVNIIPREKYYKNEIIDISDKIDYTSGIKMIPYIAQKKYIEIGLDCADTYANKIYKKKANKEYGKTKLNTGYDFNNEVENIFDGNIFSLTQPFTFAPNAYMGTTLYDNTTVIDYLPQIRDTQMKLTRFKTNSTLSNYETDEETISANRAEISKGRSWPMMCYFGDDNEQTDVGANIVFFSGYRNGKGVNDGIYYTVYDQNRELCEKLFGGEIHLMYPDDSMEESNTKHFVQFIPIFSNYFYPRTALHDSWIADVPDITYLKGNSTGALWLNYEDECKYHFDADDNLPYDVADNFYYKYWYNYLSDVYDKNNKIVEVNVTMDVLKDPKEALRKFYKFENSVWSLNKIEDYQLNKDKTAKCTFIKVKDIRNYTGEQIENE